MRLTLEIVGIIHHELNEIQGLVGLLKVVPSLIAAAANNFSAHFPDGGPKTGRHDPGRRDEPRHGRL